MTQSPSPRRRPRRFGPPPPRRRSPWSTVIYAAVLVVVLVLVLLFARYYAPSVATAVLAVSDAPQSVAIDATATEVTNSETSADGEILEARNELFGAIYAAQRAALEAVQNIEASEATP